jgi:transcriptional regulator with XRE-family HTH domain
VRHTKDPEIDEQVAAFGQSMRVARKRAGFSQIVLARATGLDRAAVSFLERAERSPDLSTLVRVAGALDMAPAALLEGIGCAGAHASGPALDLGRQADAASHALRFGANLRAVRKHAGMSQETLAHEAGVDRAAVSVYERGVRGPNLRTLLKLARALQLRPGALLAGIG